MINTVLAGVVLGLGIFLLLRALFPARPGLLARLAALDQARDGTSVPRAPLIAAEEDVSEFRRTLGVRLARFYESRGWEVRSTKADLALLGRSFEGFLATKLLLGVSGLLAFPLLVGWLALMGWGARCRCHCGRPWSSAWSSSCCPTCSSSGTPPNGAGTSGTPWGPSSTSWR